mgnify:CR=1 FL=1|jgi:hypothetical protein
MRVKQLKMQAFRGIIYMLEDINYTSRRINCML